MNESLTAREKEVLCLMAKEQELTNKEIAERLGLHEFGVQTHIQNIRYRLGIRSRGELIKYAIEHGLCDETK